MDVSNHFFRQESLDFITAPWDYEGSTLEKVTLWAAFFFVGWISYPLAAIARVYHWINQDIEDLTYTNPISQTLANFNNSRTSGQVNGLYITTNETNLDTTRQMFAEHPRPLSDIQTIHIGCATWHNFDIMCARRSTYGLIVDFNPKNALFIRKSIELINASESRLTFVQAMTEYLNSLRGSERGLFFHPDQVGLPTERIERELSRVGSWLSSDEDYQHIKEHLVSNDRLVAITENITHSETFANIRTVLDQNHIAIDTLYVSNISNFMNTLNKKSAFVRSIKHMLDNNTIFINCPRLGQRNSLRQIPLLGREVLSEGFQPERLFDQDARAGAPAVPAM